MRKRNKKTKGFTLIEILVVIAILSILVVILVPSSIKILKETKKNSFIIDARKVFSIAERENLTEEGIIKISNRYCLSESESSTALTLLDKNGIFYDVVLYNNKIIEYKVSSKDYSVSVANSEGVTLEDINKENTYSSAEEQYQLISCGGSEEYAGYYLTFNPLVLDVVVGNPLNFFSGVYGYNGESGLLSSQTDDSGKITVNKTQAQLVEGVNIVTYTYHGKSYERVVLLVPSQVIVEFTGNEETVVIAESGNYKIESYGAQGFGSGGKGGYAAGELYLSKNDIITVNVGGQNGYNGGGNGIYNGGGATTVKKGVNTLLISAGGGGGIAGTSGGNGTGAGGSGSVGSGYNGTTAISPYTSIAGSSGTTGGGGGSGNIYKDCTGYGQVYNSCKTGSNTCQSGYVDANCNSCYYGSSNECVGGYVNGTCAQYKCSSSICGQTCTCPSGFTLSGSYCTKNYASSGACINNCSGSCDVVTCIVDPSCSCKRCSAAGCNEYNQVWDSCATTTNTCEYGCDRVYSSCATGSNTCVGGYEDAGCNAFSADKYNSGQGGNNVLNSSFLSNTSTSNGLREGNGRVILTLIGA